MNVELAQKIEHLLDKGSGRLNEDCLVIEKNLFGVFDGASSLEEQNLENGETGGLIAATTARDEFAKNHFPLHRLGIRANQAIHTRMIHTNLNLSQRHQLWSTSAAVVRIKDHHLEWLQTGDAQIILIHKDGSFKVLAQRQDHDYDTLTLLKKNNFKINSEFKEQLKRVRAGMNKSYGVFNGDPSAMDFTLGSTRDLSDVKTVLMFTDGLCLPQPTPRPKKEFHTLVQLYKELGLEGLKDHIRSIEARDPDIRVYPRFKCHDDIAAIAVHL